MILAENYSEYKFIRPRMKKGQAIVFHPNLLHGGSKCIGRFTRISIELRILRIDKFKKCRSKYILQGHYDQ